MDDFIFGANILENLTTGMYQDSKIIYREYIQNACDQIDKAEKCGILSDNTGEINIWLNQDKRIVTIEDNATGISVNDFQNVLGNIANSDKKIGEDKGFRGIGRLCGLAYCSELIFTSTYKGENVISVMRCDAKKMRELISQSENGIKLTASEVLKNIYEFSTEQTTETDAHWFKVELVNINSENTDLLDFKQIKEYLSFISPVPYSNGFIYRTEIYKYAKDNNLNIDEYNINLDGEPIFKNYKTKFKTSKGEDDIYNVAFKPFYDDDNNLLAWIWIGESNFKAIIAKDCSMRGLRLRKENIQIGNEDALQKLFKEERGNHYFIGEVFAVSKDLIPNSQRDYFNENSTRLLFERKLKDYFNNELKKIYYDSSAINSAFNKITNYEDKINDISEKTKNNYFNDKEHLNKALEESKKLKIEAEKAKSDINKKKHQAIKDNNILVANIISRIEEKHKPIDEVYLEKPLSKQLTNRGQTQHRTDKLSSLSRNERKLISKIFNIILNSTDEKTADKIIKNIEEEL